MHYYAQVSIETEASRQSRQYLAAEEEIQACWRRGVAAHRARGAPGSYADTMEGAAVRQHLTQLEAEHRARQAVRQR